jgi:hypothetical protein
VDIDVNLLFIKGKFNIAELQVGAVLEAQLPEPMLLRGRVAARYSILGGVVSGKFSIGLELKKGSPCEVQSFPTSPAVGQPVVSETYPNKNDEIQVFDDVIVSTNLAVRDVQTYEFTNDNGDVSRHFYKVRLTQVDVMQGTKKLATLANSDVVFKDDFTLVLTPRTALPAKEKLSLVIAAEAYDTDIEGTILKTVGKETRTVEFKTGARPEKVYDPMVSYSAPGKNQKYWYKGYAKPKVSLKQNGYEYLFDPTYNGIPSEYKWLLYKKVGADSTVVGTYDLSAAFQGIETLYITAENGEKCGYASKMVTVMEYIIPPQIQLMSDQQRRQGNTFMADGLLQKYRLPTTVTRTIQSPRTCTYTETLPSRSFSFDKLNDLTLDKKATYRMEVIRRPKQIQQKATATTTVTTTNAVASSDADNAANIATRSLSITKSNAQEIAIIYTNVFSISEVNDVVEKIKIDPTIYTESPNSLGQQNVASTDNLDGDLPGGGYRPYLTVVGTIEPLDIYDNQRIAANGTITQSAGLDFLNRIQSRNSRLKTAYGSEYSLVRNTAPNYSSGRDSWYHGKVMDASLNNFVRAGNSGAELVFNSVNVQWAMSSLMIASAKSIRANSPNCGYQCVYAPTWFNPFNHDCADKCYMDESPFTLDWTDVSVCVACCGDGYVNGCNWYNKQFESRPSAQKYNPGSYSIIGTFNYTAPSTIPDRFTDKLKSGSVKTYNFSFTPPSR